MIEQLQGIIHGSLWLRGAGLGKPSGLAPIEDGSLECEIRNDCGIEELGTIDIAAGFPSG